MKVVTSQVFLDQDQDSNYKSNNESDNKSHNNSNNESDDESNNKLDNKFNDKSFTFSKSFEENSQFRQTKIGLIAIYNTIKVQKKLVRILDGKTLMPK